MQRCTPPAPTLPLCTQPAGAHIPFQTVSPSLLVILRGREISHAFQQNELRLRSHPGSLLGLLRKSSSHLGWMKGVGCTSRRLVDGEVLQWGQPEMAPSHTAPGQHGPG